MTIIVNHGIDYTLEAEKELDAINTETILWCIKSGYVILQAIAK